MQVNKFKTDLEDRELNRESIELLDAQIYFKAGYKVWVVWEDQMKIREILMPVSSDSIIRLSNGLTIAFMNKKKRKKHRMEALIELNKLAVEA